jgi:hypothetical protein
MQSNFYFQRIKFEEKVYYYVINVKKIFNF